MGETDDDVERFTEPLNGAKHPRGVFRDEFPPDGHVVFNIFTACGHNVTHVRSNALWFDPINETKMWDYLDERCPLYACHHCPFRPTGDATPNLKLAD